MSNGESGQAPQIGVTVSRDRDRELLSGLFDDGAVRAVTGAVPADIDLCVVDETTLQTNPERFATWREQQSPVFTPVVLLTEDSPATTRTEHAQQSPVRCDSIIEVPLPEAELRVRLDNLLERRAVSRKLADEKQLTASIFDSSPLAKLVLGPDGTIERANARAGELFDVPHAELVGRPYNTAGWIILAEGEKRVIENGFPFRKVFEAEAPISDHECSITRANGDDLLLSVTAVPIRDEADAVAHVLLTIEDITERKTREDELQQMRNAVDKAPIGIVVTDPTQEDNPMVYVNDGFVAETGYTREEAVGQNCRFLQGEDTDETTVAELRQAIDAEEPASVTIRNYRADGSAFWNHLEIAPVHDESGAVVNYIGFQQDVTERKEREEALQETRQRLAVVLAETNTGVWTFQPESNTITPIKFPDGLGLSDEASAVGEYIEQIHPADREAVTQGIKTAIESGDSFDIEFRLADDDYERWLHSHGTVVADANGDDRVVGVTTEVTERVHRKTALEKRERLLRKLHTATGQYYPLESAHAVAEFVIEFLETALDLDHASMKLFDEDDGLLRPVCNSAGYDELPDALDTVAPGETPIWEAYQTGESRSIDAPQLEATDECSAVTLRQLHAVPVGDFGVVVVYLTPETAFSNVDIDLIEVVTTNAEAVLRGLESAEGQAQLAQQLSAHRTEIETLQAVVETIQSMQDRVSEADTRAELDTAVCEELLAPDSIDFVWIGRPRATETTLEVTASAGDGEQYLDAVRSVGGESSLPAQIAATKKEPYASNAISTHVRETDWAKEALSHGYQSVHSIPLVHDGVLYGVLTAYSTEDGAFDETYTNLCTDAASLLLNYTRMLDQRPLGSNQAPTTVTFELADESCPLQRLAADTGSEIKVNTIARATDDTVTVVATIIDGDREAVCEDAATATAIRSATPFGTDGSQQLLLEFPKPFLATDVEKHGGRLLTARATPESSQVQIRIASSESRQSLFEFITTQFADAELIAQEETPDPPVDETKAIDTLTERQREILNAAYHGGYYETPRGVTGEDLAASFDISSPAVYNHLQAAHRKIIQQMLEHEQPVQNETLDS